MNEPKRLKLETPSNPKLTPILADELCKELPLRDVYVATIKNPKTTSNVVVQLNSVLPIPELLHLKRVRGKQILLFPKVNLEQDDVLNELKKCRFDIDLIENTVQICKVAKISPVVRKQYEAVRKLWPCNFHSNPYLEKLSTNTLFSDEEMEQHADFMKMAIDVCKLSGVKSSAVIVDPSVHALVGVGFDNCEDYPTKHGVMVAIDNVAKTQKGGVWKNHRLYDGIKIYLEKKYRGVKFISNASEESQYLCTGYSVYSTYEPCITCAMALVHSRVKRVFYGAKSEKGGLGSLCKIHVVENLNHHYEAFAGLLEAECRSLSL